MEIEFENVFESELVAALHRALALAKVHNTGLVDRLEELVKEAERYEASLH